MNLDKDLAGALRHKAPSTGFANRVMERIDGSAASRRRTIRIRVLRSAMAAGLAMVIATGVWLQQQQDERIERAQGEAAKKLALIALHIASEKANLARDQVRRTEAHSITKGTDHETTATP